MFVEGEVLRDGWRDLDLSKIDIPVEMPVHVDGPDEGTAAIGVAQLSRRSDGNLWVEFYISDLDTFLLKDHQYFALAFTEAEDGSIIFTHLGLTDRNLDSDIKPVAAY